MEQVKKKIYNKVFDKVSICAYQNESHEIIIENKAMKDSVWNNVHDRLSLETISIIDGARLCLKT